MKALVIGLLGFGAIRVVAEFFSRRDTSQGYTLRSHKDRIKYIGETNDPQRRAAEHERDGKTGRMIVETDPMPRADAHRWEKQKLADYQNENQGMKPVYNRTQDG